MNDTEAPWTATLEADQYSLVFYFLVLAGLALFAHFLWNVTTRNQVSERYRPAVLASMCIAAVAFVSYVVLVVKLDLGYDETANGFVPNTEAIWSWAPRYMDWSVTVPLLLVQFIAVSTLTGTVARRTRIVAVAAAFLMIFTGYLGGVVIDQGENLAALWTWGLISTFFFIVLYAIIIATLIRSLRSMSREIGSTYRFASILLLAVWFVYPIVFGLQGYTSGGGWTTVEHIMLSTADIIAKVGFGVLIHRVAVLRTAEDTAALAVPAVPATVRFSVWRRNSRS